jgi:probable HAF family extracellular repeat protein
MSVVASAAACSTATRAERTGLDTSAPPASGTPAASDRPSPVASPPARSPVAPDVARPRVLAGGAPRAAGIEVSVLRLPTSRPGGRVTGLSKDGVAVGTEGRRGVAAVHPDGERGVRWDARGRPQPLTALAPAADPRIGPDGLIAYTARRTRVTPLDAVDRVATADPATVTGDSTAETADGRRPDHDDKVASVIDVGARDVLVDLRRPIREQVREGGPAPTGLWSPASGDVTPVPLAGRFLTADGGVVGNAATGVTPDHPDGTAPALWRPGGRPVELTVPRGWKGEPQAGIGDTVVGKLTRTTDAGPGQPPAAAVAWRAGRLTYLPPLGGRQSVAAAVNRRGVVAGTSQTPEGWPHAVTWRDGRVTDLGTLDGTGESWAVDISDSDVAVGYSSTTGGGRHAVAWVRGGIVDLGAAVDPAAASQAAGIVGERVYGTVSGKDGVATPVIWTLRSTAAPER